MILQSLFFYRNNFINLIISEFLRYFLDLTLQHHNIEIFMRNVDTRYEQNIKRLETEENRLNELIIEYLSHDLILETEFSIDRGCSASRASLLTALTVSRQGERAQFRPGRVSFEGCRR